MTEKNLRKTEIGLLAGGAALIGLTLFNPSASLGDVYYVWLLALAAFLGLACVRKLRFFDIYVGAGTKNYVVAAIFSALFIIMSPVTEVFRLACVRFADKTVLEAIVTPINWLFFLAAAAGLYGIVLFALRYTENIKNAEAKQANRRTMWICFALIAVVSFACAFAGYPGLLNLDSTAIWEDNSDWHTYGFVLFTKLCMAIWYNPFSIILAQTIGWSLINLLILSTLRRYKGEAAIVVYTVLILTVGLSTIKFLSSVYKDVVFSMCMLGLAVSLYRLTKEISARNIIFTAVFGALASVFRHIAVYCVCLGILAIVIYYLVKKNPKLAVSIFACCMAPAVLLYASVQVIIEVKDVTKNPSFVTYTVPLYMLGAYAASGLEMSEETISTMEKIMPVEEWVAAYERNHYSADGESRPWHPIGDRIYEFERLSLQKPVIKANWEFFTKDPIKYLSCLFDVNALVWEMSRPDGTAIEEIYELAFDTDGDSLAAAIASHPQWYPSQTNGFKTVLTPVISAIYNIPPWRILSYRSGIHNWAILFMGIITWRKDKKILFMIIPYLLYESTLLVSLPAQNVRYVFPSVQLSILFAAICFVRDSAAENTLSVPQTEEGQGAPSLTGTEKSEKYDG